MSELVFSDQEAENRHAEVFESMLSELRRHPWQDTRCTVCQGVVDIPALERHGIQTQRCRDCGHLQTNPRMPESMVPELYGRVFWETYMQILGAPKLEERVDYDYANALNMLHRDVLPFKQAGKLLDVGASNGGMVKQASDQGFEATGTEPSEEICQAARQLLGVDMLCGEVPELCLEAESYDVIMLHDTLEHLFEPVRDITILSKALAPGGIMVIETLTASSLNFKEQQAGWFLFHPLDHVHFFTEQEIARAAGEIGLEVIDLYCPHEDNWILIAQKPEGPR